MERRIKEMTEYINRIFQIAIMSTSECLKGKINMAIGDIFIKYNTPSGYVQAYNFVYSVVAKVNKIMAENPNMLEECVVFERKMKIVSDALEIVMKKDLNVTGFMINNDHFEAIP